MPAMRIAMFLTSRTMRIFVGRDNDAGSSPNRKRRRLPPHFRTRLPQKLWRQAVNAFLFWYCGLLLGRFVSRTEERFLRFPYEIFRRGIGWFCKALRVLMLGPFWWWRHLMLASQILAWTWFWEETQGHRWACITTAERAFLNNDHMWATQSLSRRLIVFKQEWTRPRPMMFPSSLTSLTVALLTADHPFLRGADWNAPFLCRKAINQAHNP